MQVPQHETVSRTHPIPISDLRSHKFQNQKHKTTEQCPAEHIPLLLLQLTDGPLAQFENSSKAAGTDESRNESR